MAEYAVRSNLSVNIPVIEVSFEPEKLGFLK